jgi:octaprenyl-diphosphate synthase
MIVLEQLCPEIAPDLERVACEIASIAASDYMPLSEAAAYVAATSGKRLRPGLLLLSARACGYSGSRCILPAAVIEVLHGVSLVHDDVIDEADTRRGAPAARTLWGNKMAVLVGDHLLAGAFKRLTESGDPALMHELAATALEMCRGQIQELLLAGPELTEAQYLEIVSAKTASLFGASCRLGAGAAAAGPVEQRALDSFGRRFGIAYQIADDLLDLAGAPEQMGKPVARDLSQGQATLPVVYALREGSASQRAELIACLNGGSHDLDLPRIRKLIADVGGLDYAADRVRYYASDAIEQLSALPRSPARDCLLTIARDGLAVPIIAGGRAL